MTRVFDETRPNEYRSTTTIEINDLGDGRYESVRTVRSPAHPEGTPFHAEFTLDAGVLHWTSNGACIPLDAIAERGLHNLPGYDPARHAAARSAEIDRVIAEYRANERPPTEEEVAEMRAAFGPETKTVVNVFTGRRTRL